MRRCRLSGAVLVLLVATPALWADAFDQYTNPILSRVAGADSVKELKQLTPALIADNDRVLKDVTAALIVVKTNDERYAKLLVQGARQRVNKERTLPMLLIHQFVTYKDGTERALQASGKNVSLFPGFRFSLDLGQVVPDELSADLRFVVEGDKMYLEPLKDARLYLLTRPIPEATAPKAGKVVVGEPFEPRYFNGKYKLYDDGRRSATLTLKVAEGGEVTGSYYSDKDGQKYDVKGKIGAQPHSIQFTVQFPRSEQVFQGWMFTRDGKAIAGSSRLAEHETAFYALRVEED